MTKPEKGPKSLDFYLNLRETTKSPTFQSKPLFIFILWSTKPNTLMGVVKKIEI
jgi:hypothetical protein